MLIVSVLHIVIFGKKFFFSLICKNFFWSSYAVTFTKQCSLETNKKFWCRIIISYYCNNHFTVLLRLLQQRTLCLENNYILSVQPQYFLLQSKDKKLLFLEVEQKLKCTKKRLSMFCWIQALERVWSSKSTVLLAVRTRAIGSGKSLLNSRQTFS